MQRAGSRGLLAATTRRPKSGRALEARHSLHDPLDRLALEDLALEQLGGKRVELGAMGRTSFWAARRASSTSVLALLVAHAQGRLGEPHVAIGRPADAGRAHRVVVDHRVGDLGDALEVVRGAGRDRAEHDLLGDPPAEQDGHVVDQLLAGLQVAVLGRQVERVPQRPPARHDRDPVDAVDRRQQLAAERVAGLVKGDDPLLVQVEHAL